MVRIEILSVTAVLRIRDVYPGSWIRSFPSRKPDPGSKRFQIPDPGSASKNLDNDNFMQWGVILIGDLFLPRSPASLFGIEQDNRVPFLMF